MSIIGQKRKSDTILFNTNKRLQKLSGIDYGTDIPMELNDKPTYPNLVNTLLISNSNIWEAFHIIHLLTGTKLFESFLRDYRSTPRTKFYSNIVLRHDPNQTGISMKLHHPIWDMRKDRIGFVLRDYKIDENDLLSEFIKIRYHLAEDVEMPGHLMNTYRYLMITANFGTWIDNVGDVVIDSNLMVQGLKTEFLENTYELLKDCPPKKIICIFDHKMSGIRRYANEVLDVLSMYTDPECNEESTDLKTIYHDPLVLIYQSLQSVELQNCKKRIYSWFNEDTINYIHKYIRDTTNTLKDQDDYFCSKFFKDEELFEQHMKEEYEKNLEHEMMKMTQKTIGDILSKKNNDIIELE